MLARIVALAITADAGGRQEGNKEKPMARKLLERKRLISNLGFHFSKIKNNSNLCQNGFKMDSIQNVITKWIQNVH